MNKFVSTFISIFMLIIFSGCNYNINPTKKETYQNILLPLCYNLGQNNWDKAEDISPDAFVVFYFTIIDELTLQDYAIDTTYGNPLIPADDLESTVQKYFDFEIPKDYIKKSEYYDKNENSYYTGGIGSTVDINPTKAKQENNQLTLWYDAWINSTDYKDNWDGTVTVFLDDEGGFKYQSFSTNRVLD